MRGGATRRIFGEAEESYLFTNRTQVMQGQLGVRSSHPSTRNAILPGLGSSKIRPCTPSQFHRRQTRPAREAYAAIDAPCPLRASVPGATSARCVSVGCRWFPGSVSPGSPKTRARPRAESFVWFGEHSSLYH